VTDAGTDSSAHDGGDASVGPPPALNLCAHMDAIFNVGSNARSNIWSWPSTIAIGFPSVLPDGGASDNTYVTWDGFQNLVFTDCNVQGFYEVSVINGTGADLNGAQWQNNIQSFTQRIFGCPTAPDAGADAGLAAGFGFGLVPPELYGNLLSTADLKRLGDLYVEAVIQAVTNAVTDPNNANVPANGALLTGDEIDGIQQWVEYEETLYPSIVVSNRFSPTTDMCPSDGGPEGG
jgi:hypothetical protein